MRFCFLGKRTSLSYYGCASKIGTKNLFQRGSIINNLESNLHSMKSIHVLKKRLRVLIIVLGEGHTLVNKRASSNLTVEVTVLTRR